MKLLFAALISLAAATSVGGDEATAKPATVKGIEIVADDEVTRFLATLTKETGFTTTVLSQPDRVIVDFENVAFDLPTGAGQNGQGLIRQVRYGILEQGKSRIVIDTLVPVQIKSSKLLPKKGKSKPRLALELKAIVAEAVVDGEAAEVQSASPETTGSLPALTVPSPVPAEAAGSGKRVIVLDPGHGGIDSGALSPSRTREKDVVFAFSKELKRVLESGGKYDVRLTRDEDKFMTLTDRLAVTHRSGADLFISIHADILRGKSVAGATVYTLSEDASDEEAAALARKENTSDLIGGVNLSSQAGPVVDVLIELAQRESNNHAQLFSQAVLEELKPITNFTGKPLRSAGFVVLKSPDVPSILVELGFLSNREDEKKLKDLRWQTEMSEGLAKAIDRHFEAMDAAE
jgi:N-acetylmuramoyl-L-alanine amidase